MTFLPIVERELRIAARLKSTYRNRLFAAGVAGIMAMTVLLFGAAAATPAELGANLFVPLAYVIFGFCLLEGVRKTADCLSEERREGTLGLLFLTDLRSYHVILGKLAATSLGSFYGLLGVFPILALSLLLGGVTQGEFWRVVLALTNALFFSLSAGMWVSARSRLERRAMLGAFWVILAFLSIPRILPIFPVYLTNPFYAFRGAFDEAYIYYGASYWGSLLAVHAMAWAMLAGASWTASRLQEHELVAKRKQSPRRQRWEDLQFGNAQRRERLRLKLLRLNPALWLAARQPAHRVFLSVLIGFAVTGELLLVIFQDASLFSMLGLSALIINCLLKLRLGAQACHCMAEARDSNALEMLLCTPLTVDEIIRGQTLLLRRIFLVPLAIILGLEVLGWGIGMTAINHWDNVVGIPIDDWPGKTGYSVLFLIYFGASILELFALSWVGLWYGLSTSKISSAALKTGGFVLLLPWLFSCFIPPMFLGWPVFCMNWARANLRRNFRALAAQRYAPPVSTEAPVPQHNPATA